MASESEQKAQQYLEGAKYPAGKGDLASVAKKNDAPQEFVDQLQSLPDTGFSDSSQEKGEFSNHEEVVETLERLEPLEEQEAASH